jgi:hypothetical protein
MEAKITLVFIVIVVSREIVPKLSQILIVRHRKYFKYKYIGFDLNEVGRINDSLYFYKFLSNIFYQKEPH